jgi:hypothetical protein
VGARRDSRTSRQSGRDSRTSREGIHAPVGRALSDPAGYAAAYPNCDILNGDCNGDTYVDFDDINPFVVLLSGGQ